MKNKIVLIALLLALPALGLRLLFLGHQSLWMDEAFSVWMASQPLHTLLQVIRHDAHPPLYYTLLHFWMKYGHNEAYLRIPSVFFGVLTTIILFFLANQLFDTPKAIFIAGFWACCFTALQTETEVRMYAPATTFPLLATLFFWQAYKNSTPKNWSLYILCAILCLYTHYYTGFVLLANLFFLAIKKQTKKAALFSGILAASFIPWLPIFLAQLKEGAGQLTPTISWSDFYGYFSGYLGLHYLLIHGSGVLAVTVASAFSIAVFLFGAYRLARYNNEKALFLILLFAVPCFVPYAMTKLTPLHIFLFRYTIIFLPYFLLIFFFGLLSIPGKIGRPIYLALYFTLIISNVYIWILFQTGPAFQSQDWRGVAKFLKANLKPGDNVFVEQLMSLYPLWYYMPSYLKLEYINNGLGVSGTTRSQIQWYAPAPKVPLPLLEKWVKTGKREWLVLCQVYFGDPYYVYANWLYKHLQLQHMYLFRSIDFSQQILVFLFSRHPSKKKENKKLLQNF
jgi:4-amino-4-deoxy-L-arabinose transferase-like glycosyltransferase